jgi:hypothetical protein
LPENREGDIAIYFNTTSIYLYKYNKTGFLNALNPLHIYFRSITSIKLTLKTEELKIAKYLRYIV